MRADALGGRADSGREQRGAARTSAAARGRARPVRRLAAVDGLQEPLALPLDARSTTRYVLTVLTVSSTSLQYSAYMCVRRTRTVLRRQECFTRLCNLFSTRALTCTRTSRMNNISYLFD